MHQAVIVSAMLVSGLALFGSAAWIQADRAAWTSVPENEEIPIHATISSLREAPVVREQPEHVTVELPPVEIVGRRPIAMRDESPAIELVTEPCSSWEDIGPERVIEGTPVGTRRVRQLCSRPLQTSERPEPATPLAVAQY